MTYGFFVILGSAVIVIPACFFLNRPNLKDCCQERLSEHAEVPGQGKNNIAGYMNGMDLQPVARCGTVLTASRSMAKK